MKKSEDSPESRMGLNDIVFIVFKHKRLILWSAFLGLLGALMVYIFVPPPYESQSKLLVRYVVDRNVVDPQENQTKTADTAYNDSLIAAEKEILSSWDLAAEVAAALSTEVSSDNSITGQNLAARRIHLGLSVTGTKGNNVISVSYKDSDPRYARRVLEELIKRYFVKHLQVHRSESAFQYVANETAQVQTRLNQIEEELKRAKKEAGIVSLKETMDGLSVQLAKSQEALNAAQEATASQRAKVKELSNLLGATGPEQAPATGMPANRKEVRDYQALGIGIATLRQKELDLLSRFTSDSQMVKANQSQIGQLESRQRELEKRYPGLLTIVPEGSTRGLLFERNPQLELISERATLAALEEKTGVLAEQFRSLQEQAIKFAEITPNIAMLERKKELEETNYKYFQESLDKARIDEALDPTKMPNISVVQKPTPALAADGPRNKILLGLGGGGLFVGLTLAMLIELVFDRTLKRSAELEDLNIPRLICIPDWKHQTPIQLADQPEDEPKSSPGDQDLPGEALKRRQPRWSDFMRPYGEALRDRLALYFQLKHMNSKPKLVALTACSPGAGTSTIAGALALACSESGEGKVLFVNMKSSEEEIHPLFEKNTTCSLSDALEPNRIKAIGRGNLYLATANSLAPGATQMIPKRFYDLIPHIKGSDFEYIIFDMPPLGPTSSTLAMAGFMDKVLLVIESEVSSLDSVRRAYSELVAARADVSAILNKSKTYGPKSLQSEF